MRTGGATPAFWDGLWTTDNWREAILKGKHDRFVTEITRRYLKPNLRTKILEGGCGKGQFVYALKEAGYNAHGIDYAKQTIAAIKKAMPQLSVQEGDVRALPFPDGFFDGYWSLGVIEHFYTGYTEIIKEMSRVLCLDGYLFLTFPYHSPLRRLKAYLGFYPIFSPNSLNLDDFYQFALNAHQVIEDLKGYNFRLVYQQPFDGIKGFKDEVLWAKPWLQKLYDHPSFFAKILTALLSKIFAPFASHSILLIFKKYAA